MNLSICTISFRHQLVSIDHLVTWANANHFNGIELWGAHAKNLMDQPEYGQKWLSGYGLKATMLSDYLPLLGTEHVLYYKVQLLSRLAKHWGAKKIRTFAGDKGSANTSIEERRLLVKQLQKICDWLLCHKLNLVIETHPNTLADSVDSTTQLFAEVAKDNLKLNFDVIHVWESKANVLNALDNLMPFIDHFHFKNISDAEKLDVFAPANVYAAAGTREGMVPLFEGAVDYREFFEYVNQYKNTKLATVDASLEWFGDQCKTVLSRDRYLIQQLSQSYRDTNFA
jgi:3-dehydroshikimate dehydratase